MTDGAPGRFLLVELKDDLATQLTTQQGVWASILIVPGVKSISDVALFTAGSLLEEVSGVVRENGEPPEPRRRRGRAA
jgi:hypothetical protein